MNVVPQYKVIGPYDRIIHNKKNYAKRPDIGQTSEKMHAFDFEAKNLCNSLNTLKVRHRSCQLPVLLLVIYTFILNIY